MAKGMSKAERRAAKKAERRASRSLVVREKPLAPSRDSAHIPSKQGADMSLANVRFIDVKPPAKPLETNAVNAPRWNYPLAFFGVALFAIAVAINILNATASPIFV